MSPTNPWLTRAMNDEHVRDLHRAAPRRRPERSRVLRPLR